MLICLAGLSLAAQENPFFLKQSVTVTATRSELDVERSPVSATTVTADEIRARNLQLVDRALNLVPGLYGFRAKGYADTLAGIGMRGFAGRGSAQPRTLVLIDGQPLNDSYTGQVTWSTLPIDELERVEVVRGSFSSLYGGNAMGGVINILTKPVERRRAEIYGQWGSMDTTRWGVRAADRWGQRLGISAAFDRLQSGGYASQRVTSAGTVSTSGTPVTGFVPTLTSTGGQTFLIGDTGNNWWAQYSARVRADYTFSRKTTAYVQLLRQHSDYGYDAPNSYLRTAAGAVFNNGTALWTYNGVSRRASVTPATFMDGAGGVRSWLASAKLHHEFQDGSRLRLGGGWQNAPTNYYSTVSTSTISDRPYRSWFGEGQWTRRLLRTHELVAGTELRRDSSSLIESTVPDWTKRDVGNVASGTARGQAYTQGVYAQDSWTPMERLSVVGGARYDYWRTSNGTYQSGSAAATNYDSRSSNSVTAKLAGRYQIAGLGVRASAGNSFRNPTVYDLYRTWRSSSGITYAANPDLQPEHMVSGEVGIGRRWSNKSEFDVAVYQNSVSDLIYRSTDYTVDASGKYRPVVNAARSRARGLEASGKLPLRAWLLAQAGYTYTNAKITEQPTTPENVGKRIPFVPNHVSTFGLIAARPRWTGTLTGRYVSRVYSSDLNTDTVKGVYGAYDPYFEMEASAGVPVGRHVTLEVGADNLLGRRYYYYYAVPGRTVFGRVRLRL